MPVLQVIREVQIPLVAVMLLGGCLTKLHQMLRTGSTDSDLGPTTLFPLRLRRSATITLCTIEGILGLCLIVTASASHATGGLPAASVARIGAGLLFVIATSTLIELRTVRPDVGCGCFGDFSTAPVSGRTIARSAFLAAAILWTLGLRALTVPHTGKALLEVLAIVCAELLLIGFLSPEVGEGLIRLGYSEPCELRNFPSSRTLAALRRSKQWRRHSGLLASDVPADIWRELCWRYIVYPSNYAERPAEIVFAVYLQHRRPIVQAALVDSGTGLALPWPGSPDGGAWPRPPAPTPAPLAPDAPDAPDAPHAPDARDAPDKDHADDTGHTDDVPRLARVADLPLSTRL